MLRSTLAVCGLGIFLAGLPATGVAQSFLDLTDQSPPYRLFLPADVDPASPLPLVVMMHGCNQDSRSFADVTRMNALAAQHGFVAVYPEQTGHPLGCWRWYEPAHQMRDLGEPAAVATIVDAVKGRPDISIDDDRIYVVGLSAGAAMATILAATYPDIFAAVGLAAGVPYGAASDCFSAFNAMQRISARLFTAGAAGAWADYWSAYGACLWAGAFNPFLSSVPAPDALGRQAFEAMGSQPRVMPVVVFHGLADERVRPVNGADLVGQWAQTNDLALDGVDNDAVDDTAESEIGGSVAGGYDFVERTYEDNDRNIVIMAYTIDDMGHAWPGGAPGMEYSDPLGPDASALMWAFFTAHPKEETP